jgi:hypothetical protein
MSSKIQASKPKPYDITIPQEKVDRAKQLAELTDLQPFLDRLDASADESRKDADFTNDFGIKSSRLVDLVERYKTSFNWSEWEGKIKAMGEHYRTTVTGIEDEPSLEVHFILRKSQKKDAPYLMLVRKSTSSLSFHHLASRKMVGLDPSSNSTK